MTSRITGPWFNTNTVFPGIKIPHCKEKKIIGYLTFIMRIPILVRQHLYIQIPTGEQEAFITKENPCQVVFVNTWLLSCWRDCFTAKLIDIYLGQHPCNRIWVGDIISNYLDIDKYAEINTQNSVGWNSLSILKLQWPCHWSLVSINNFMPPFIINWITYQCWD